MSSDLILNLLAGKVTPLNFSPILVRSVEWKSQNSTENSILFYKINDSNVEKFLESMKDVKYGIIVVNQNFKELKNLQNVLITSNLEWLECQKILMDHFYPFPFSEVKLVGITGTNGKTTTTDLVRQMCMEAKKNVLTIGTLGVKKNKKKILEEGLTTPPYIDLRKIFYEHAQDVDLIVMEVSSHSLVQERIYKLKFDVAAWTSFSQDHLDFHSNLDEYFQAKTLLIEKHLKPGSYCFVPSYEEELYSKLNHYSSVIKTTSLLERKIEKLPLFFMSHFNKSNLEVAWDVTEILWKKKINPDLFSYEMTEGRFSIFNHKEKMIIIDFAHTPDAITNICNASIQAFPKSNIHLVFGCGGNRDKSKRPLMGEAAENGADYVYITSDNPRFEKPEDIIQDIVKGLKLTNHIVVVKREEAIANAFHNMKAGDVLIIAGKGHENYQIINGVKHEYSDFKVIEDLTR